MFESLTHWFDSLKNEGKLFEHPDDELLHSSLASVLYHVISADQRVDAREKHEFARIIKALFFDSSLVILVIDIIINIFS